MGFGDIFEHVKQEEKTSALNTLPNLLEKIDALPEKEKLGVLIDNVLAGNMFDWGYSIYWILFIYKYIYIYIYIYIYNK